MNLRILTPERVLYDGTVEQVTIPTQSGEITVLSHHIPLVSLLKPGELIINREGDTVAMVVSTGMLHIGTQEVIILADTAERIEEIIEERAEEARKRAEDLLSQQTFDTTEYATIAAKLEKELARLRIARKHRSRRV